MEEPLEHAEEEEAANRVAEHDLRRERERGTGSARAGAERELKGTHLRAKGPPVEAGVRRVPGPAVDALLDETVTGSLAVGEPAGGRCSSSARGVGKVEMVDDAQVREVAACADHGVRAEPLAGGDEGDTCWRAASQLRAGEAAT